MQCIAVCEDMLRPINAQERPPGKLENQVDES
jgi:hypothetical protein